jgi:F0F1-type ATP synthase membrane subunit b/b'
VEGKAKQSEDNFSNIIKQKEDNIMKVCNDIEKMTELLKTEISKNVNNVEKIIELLKKETLLKTEEAVNKYKNEFETQIENKIQECIKKNENIIVDLVIKALFKKIIFWKNKKICTK